MTTFSLLVTNFPTLPILPSSGLPLTSFLWITIFPHLSIWKGLHLFEKPEGACMALSFAKRMLSGLFFLVLWNAGVLLGQDKVRLGVPEEDRGTTLPPMLPSPPILSTQERSIFST